MLWLSPVHQVVWSLLIGAATFAIASLWPLSDWACTRLRVGWFMLAAAVTGACVALDLQAANIEVGIDVSRWVAYGFGASWIVLPLYLAFPAAVCIASAQSLRLAGVSPRVARLLALAVAAMAVVVAPFAAVGAACQLTSECF
jgi:hypothetical protein